MDNPTNSLFFAGLASVESPDSSGEVLEINDDLDISSYNDGTAMLNWEHIGGGNAKDTPLTTVGKVVYARKLRTINDCENDFQRKLYEKYGLPCLFVIGRLADGAGHDGARALAALLRDEAASSDKNKTVSLSVEGSTLSRKGNRLTACVLRGLAITTKACNKAATIDILADPNAPEGFDKDPGAMEPHYLDDIIESMKSESQSIDGVARLGQPVEFAYEEVKTESLDKALSAQGGDVAPSALSGHAVLQTEDLKRRKMAELSKRTQAALRDWDKLTPFRKFLKHKLNDVDESFVDHFCDQVDNLKIHKSEPLTVQGHPLTPNPLDDNHFDHETGELKTHMGSFKTHNPSQDRDSKEKFHNGLNDPKSNAFHDHAMSGWAKMNVLLKNKHIPPEMILHALMMVEPKEIKKSTNQHFDKLANQLKMDAPQGPHDLAKMQDLHAKTNALESGIERHGHDARTHASDLVAQKRTAELEGLPAVLHAPAVKNSRMLLGLLGGGNILLPNDKMNAQLFGLGENDKSSKEHLGKLFNDLHHDHLLGELEKHYQNHEATQHLLNHPKYKELFKDSPEQAIFPALWKHQLAEDNTLFWKKAFTKAEGDVSPKQESDYLPSDQWNAQLRSQYIQNGQKVASSREVPYSGTIPKTGTWSIDPFKGLYGREISQLRELDPQLLIPSEDTRLEGRNNDVERYAQWAREGKQSPPINVVETDKGHLKIVDGHRRWHAAKAAGSKLLGWVSPTVPHPEGKVDSEGRPMRVGLTYELAHAKKSELIQKSEQDLLPFVQQQVEQHRQWQEQMGDIPSVMMYYSHIVPKYLERYENPSNGTEMEPDELAQSIGEPQQDQFSPEELALLDEPYTAPEDEAQKSEQDFIDGMIRKAEALSIDLHVALAKAMPQASKSIMFAGKMITPGRLKGADGREYALLGGDGNHWVAAPKDKVRDLHGSDLIKFPKSQNGKLFDVVAEPHSLDHETKINSLLHGDPRYNKLPEQNALIHGTDLAMSSTTEPKGAESGVTSHLNHWRNMANGSLAYVKGDEKGDELKGFGSSKRELTYANVARDFFGMGNYLPKVAMFRHPKSGEEHAVIEAVKGARHIHNKGTMAYPIPTHQDADTIKKLGDAGELDKLAMMNMVLGNNDRHPHNMLMDKDNNLKLIDHGYSLKGHGSRNSFKPSYLTAYHNLLPQGSDNQNASITKTVHPEAKAWALNLNPDQLEKQLKDHGLPDKETQAAKWKLQNLQQHLVLNPHLTATVAAKTHKYPNPESGDEVKDMREHAFVNKLPGADS